MVTAVETGEVKRDIAYHGDTLNTASRIQGVCNDYGKSFLAFQYLIDRIGGLQYLKTEPLSRVQLKGKAGRVGFVCIERPPATRHYYG